VAKGVRIVKRRWWKRRRGEAGGGRKRGRCRETERRGERDVVSVGAAVLGYSQIGGHRQSMT